MDGDGLVEVLVTDYSGGGRVYVIENKGVDTWELVYATPWMDSTSTSQNARYAVCGDLDGDGKGEFMFLSGRSYSATNPLVGQLNLRPGLFVYEFTGTDDDYGTGPASIYDFPDDLPDRWVSEQMVVADVDGDGQQELLFPNNGRNNRYDNWYILSVTGDIGSGFEVWVEEARISSRASEGFDPVNRGGGSPYAILPADLDGDGTYELSMHSWNNFNFTNGDVLGPDQYQFPDANAQNVYVRASSGDHVALFGGVVVDINGDGDDEVFYPNFYTGQLAVLNYESGENPLEITTDQLIFPLLEGPTNLGITTGDLDGDGHPELIGAGYTDSRAQG
ncbi:FG-GAP repeat protein (plasmid) [Rhodothermus marinus SG0.5JP17-172]|uniref:FG-GAP repeat domain-containing protein n=2 Tax=Rhodothermus marinus TaxID=29549 RepID=UPI000223D0ED|nr:FG-GAP repeat protein [Rhodothermus marinus SG0.5JP17-172]